MPRTSRPDLGWDDLAGLQVGIWGVGIEGRASISRATEVGAEVVLVDDRPSEETAATADAVGGRPVFATEHGGIDELAQCDVVVKAPGISRYRPDVVSLQIAGVPIAGGLGLWLHDQQARDRLDRVVLVTGTKGKSTTTSVLGHLLTELGRRTAIGGNLGTPPWDPAAPAAVERWVIEVSSFQATDLPVAPPVVAVTSLHPDHLDWHGSFDRYAIDKLSVCTLPGAEVTVAADTIDLRAWSAQLAPRVEWVTAPPAGGWADALGLLGAHNLRNAEIARVCLEVMGEAVAADPRALAGLAAGFTPLPSRLTIVATVAGVDFVDDSLSTNVLPTVAAVEAFADRPVALLAGGFDRGIDYAPLAAPLRARTQPTVVFTLPDNGPRVAAALRAETIDVRETDGIPEATAAAYEWARAGGGVVLLSPAAPSFGRYRDFRDRAEAFAAAAVGLREPSTGSGSAG